MNQIQKIKKMLSKMPSKVRRTDAKTCFGVQNKFWRPASVISGIIVGLIALATIMAVLAFTEPSAAPGITEPTNADSTGNLQTLIGTPNATATSTATLFGYLRGIDEAIGGTPAAYAEDSTDAGKLEDLIGTSTPTVAHGQRIFNYLKKLYDNLDFPEASNVCDSDTVKGSAGTLSITASVVLTGNTYCSTAGTYNADNLSDSTVKKGTAYGVSSTGAYSGYPGTGWSGSGLTESACNSALDWEWFEDANGDGDTTDPEDGICVRTSTVTSDSWNGAEQVTPNNLAAFAAGGGTANSVSSSTASWTADAYKNHIVKITSGAAAGCWGRVKTNTATEITVYGSWLTPAYASNCGIPDATSVFQVYDDWGQYDNSFIGDYTCDGTAFPNGAVVLGSYPSSGTIALAVADCYDGTRDLLPNETDRAVISGTATAADATSITDTSLSLDTNVWIGQKVLITGGTGADSYGFIESNTATTITVTDWLGGADPAVDSTFSIIYIVPHSGYVPDAEIDGDDWDAKANNGPLQAEVLNNWKGTRLPTHSDFFGFCGYKDGLSNYETTTGTYTADKTYGNYGGQVGRTDEFMDLANSGYWEWLSEQHYYHNYARVAGNYACSYFGISVVYYGNRFRAVFRP